MTREQILNTLYDGDTIAKGSAQYVFATAGNYAIVVTIPNHRETEQVLQYKLSTNPTTDPGNPTNEVITGNVVGVTLIGVGAGTTLDAEVTAVGW